MREYGEHEFDEAYNAWREENWDPDEPVPYWPDDEYLSSPDRLEDMGHA